jgi:hypothetical protein
LKIVVNRIGNLIKACPTRSCVYKINTNSDFAQILSGLQKSCFAQDVSSESSSSLILHLCDIDHGSVNFYTSILKIWLDFQIHELNSQSSIILEHYDPNSRSILEFGLDYSHLEAKYIQVYCFYHFIFK